ncbi:glycosyltransferase [Janibacter cremeus]|uniref:glycosyltransferase n=1 Tax=Janibacter cremeus TaxID=1285192 RepID=UPI003D652152
MKSAPQRRHRLVLLTSSFYPVEGGAERQLRTVLGSLHEDIDTSVVTRNTGAQLPKDVHDTPEELRVVRVGWPPLFRGRLKALGQIYFLTVGTIRAIQAKPETVLSLQLGAASTAASIAARSTSASHIIRLTGGARMGARSEPVARSQKWPSRLHMRWITKGATLVAPGRHLLRDAEEHLPSTLSGRFYVPNAVTDCASSASNIGVSGDVLWYHRKDATEASQQLLLHLANRYPKARFTVIGRELPSAPSNTVNLGWVDDVRGVCARHRVLLNTTLFEGMPNVALQALAAGCRVLGVKNNAMMELMDSFPDNVVVSDPYDPEGFSDKLGSLLSLPRGAAQSVPDTESVRVLWREVIKGTKEK